MQHPGKPAKDEHEPKPEEAGTDWMFQRSSDCAGVRDDLKRPDEESASADSEGGEALHRNRTSYLSPE